MLAWAEQSARRLLDLDGTDERIEELTAQRERQRAELAGQGAALTALRTKAAAKLGEVVSDELTALAMPHAEVTVAVTQHDDPDGLPVGERHAAVPARPASTTSSCCWPPTGAPRPGRSARARPAVSCPG